MKSQVIMVTPEKARDWLGRKGKNRNLSPRHVKYLTNEMLAGRWELNGVPILFDAGGYLIDGQHRLEAVVASGVGVLMLVVSGVESTRAFETIDVLSRPRGVGQVAQMDGIKNANTKAAIARRLLHYDQTIDKKDFSLASMGSNTPPQDILDYLRAHHAEIDAMYTEVANSNVYVRCGAGSSLVAALVICNRVDEVSTMLFTDAITTGEYLARDSAALHLRDRLFDRPARLHRRIWDTELMALTIKAWNYFAADKPIKILRWRQDGDSPEFFPTPKGDNSCLKSA